MQCITLINFLDEYNDSSIISIQKLKPSEAIFVYRDSSVNRDIYHDLKGMLQIKFPDIEIKAFTYTEKLIDKVENLIMSCNPTNTVINLSTGPRLLCFAVYRLAIQNNIPSIYLDLENKKIVGLTTYKEENIDPELINLTVEDLVESTGAVIVKESSSFYEKHDFSTMINYFISHYNEWKIVKELFREPSRISNNSSDTLDFFIDLGGLESGVKHALNRLLEFMLDECMLVDYRMRSNAVRMRFSSRDIKSFMLFAGGWLEALTYGVVKKISGIDDARSGIVFVWDKRFQEVRNEIDVMASVDGALVCVSCKDTDNYDVDSLNELEVCAQRLGGEEVIKILVATQLPRRTQLICNRATEMGIRVIIFDGDINSFRDILRESIGDVS